MSSQSGNHTLLGRLAVAMKLITADQLEAALAEQSGRPEVNIGTVLVGRGLIDQAQLEELVNTQRRLIAKRRADKAKEAAAEQLGEEAPEPPTARKIEIRPAEPAAPGSLDALLTAAAEAGASDLHLHAGMPAKFRLRGKLYDQGEPLDAGACDQLARSALHPDEIDTFERHGQHDFCYEIAGVGRFRANIYRQLRGTDAVFRFVPPDPPSLESLGLPQELARFTSYHQGMVLVTGPTGSGKSSTLAALVNLINEDRREHILTVEDPIEYTHPSKRCLVNQRSVNRHTESFARALRAALREDPDVIVIGELRDRETIEIAMTAAETGHFVLASLHTDNSVRTINRLIGAFPPDQQEQVRSMLSESLKGVISQRLIPTADESALAVALEVLIVNRAVSNLVREQKTVQIRSLLQTGQSQGMCLLDDSIAELVRAGTISREEALLHVEDVKVLGADAAAAAAPVGER